jgi:hypothetical protein
LLDDTTDLEEDTRPGDMVEEPIGTQVPSEDVFSVQGPVMGVCSSEFNSHPMAFKDLDSQAILGKWNTVLVDSAMLQRTYVPQCMTAEFFKLNGGEELVFRVGELHQLKDEMANKDIWAYSGQTQTLLFDNMEVPTIANQYSYQPTNKFTQFLDLGIPEWKDNVLVTMTCVQIRGIAPPQMLEQMAKQATFAEMRGNMQMAEQIQEEIDMLSQGEMVNMYEVHVKDLAQWTPEKIEQLNT